MSNLLFFIFTGLLLSLNAHADYAAIKCEGALKNIELKLDETSDITKNTVTLLIEGKNTSISKLNVTQTEYGILAINVQNKTGSDTYNYQFKNLGSSNCFGVYGSNQKGSAFVEEYNSSRVINKANCDCTQD